MSGEGLLAAGGNNDLVEKDIDNIHKENVSRLSKMTEEEILIEQSKLKKQLGETILRQL